MKRSKLLNRIRKSTLAVMLSALILPQGYAWAAPDSTAEDAVSEFTNVALGKPYTTTQFTRDNQLMAYELRTDGDNGSVKAELTDGKIATSTSYDSYCNCEVFFLDKNWVGYNRQVSRSVVIDLGSSQYISSITGGFLQERTAAVELPRYIRFSVSDDKVNWHSAGEKKPIISQSQEASRQEIGVSDVNVSARYVKVELEVGMFSFVDEIVVSGRAAAAGDPAADTLPVETAPADVPPPTLEDTGGVHNIFFATYYPPATGNGPLGIWKKEHFKPYVAHVDTAGKRTDWMFDSIIFASAGDVYRDYSKKENWEEYLDQLFMSDRHIQALNDATAEAAAELNDSSRKTKVIVAIPYAAPEAQGVWGELNGESIRFNRDLGDDVSFDGRKKAVEWFVNEVVNRFQQHTYTNVELAGFYWMHEEVGFATTHEEDFVKHATAYIHSKNKKVFWIPFFQANGSTIWKELGFDAAMMQPNYYFQSFFSPNESSGALDLNRLDTTVATAKRFGTGVEIEGDYHMAWNGWGTDYDGQLYNNEYAIRKYYAYLNEYKKAGLDRGPAAYYLGARTVLQGIVDDSRPNVRTTYDETGKYVNGTYQLRDIETTTIPLPAGDVWDNPIELEAYDGYVYNQNVTISSSKWLRFPIKAGEDWVVTLTPRDTGMGMETRLWAPTQTPHSGFSYGKSKEVQSLIVSNPGTTDSYGMIRVFPDDGTSGKFQITLHKPIEDGTTQMNALKLPNKGQVSATVQAGQEIWYKISGEKTYSLALVPNSGADMDMELYYDANSGQPQAISGQPAGRTELIKYDNGFAPSFVYYVKVRAKTAGDFTLYNGIVPPGGLPVTPGISWETALELEAKEGELFTSNVSASGDDWYKFPIRAGEDWIVKATAQDGARVSLETRYFTTDAFHPHGGFSYDKTDNRLLVSNRESSDSWIYVRAGGPGTGGTYKLSLQKPIEDGKSKLNALPLGNDFAVKGTAQAAGETIWYKAAGKKNYQIELQPYGNADFDVELFWGSDYNDVLASSRNGAGQTEQMNYANPYDAKFVYFVKVTAKTPGSFKLGTAPGLSLNDTTAPRAEGITINSGAEWTNKLPVSLSLTATDEGTGVYQMQFSNDGQNWSDWVEAADLKEYTLTSSEGSKTVYVRFKDFAGNISVAIQDSIGLDMTPPVIQLSGNKGTYTADEQVDVTCSAEDLLSGIGSSICKNISGTAYSFGLGEHSYTIKAVDKAGNTAEEKVTFTVTVTFDSLSGLTDQFLQEKVTGKSLQKKLENAKSASDKGAIQEANALLQSYMNEISAQQGKAISTEDANLLIDLAQTLLK